MPIAFGSCSFCGSGTSASRLPGWKPSSWSASSRYETPASLITRIRGSSCETGSSVAASRSRYPSLVCSSQSRTRSLNSKVEELAHRRGHALDRGHVRVLDLPVRIRHVVTGHAQDRTAQVEDRLLGENRRQLGGETADARRLLDDYDASRLSGGSKQGVLVERLQRPDVEDLDRHVLEGVGCLLAQRNHRPVGDERHVVALAREACLAERHDVLALRHVTPERAVMQLRLEHDNG